MAVIGGSPLWRQTISLPFIAPQGDFSPDSLNQVRDMMYFTLFDEIIEDDSERGGISTIKYLALLNERIYFTIAQMDIYITYVLGLLDGENPIRVEKRFLGSFSVPFETIYNEGRIEGVFRIDTPTINFGYDHSASRVGRL